MGLLYVCPRNLKTDTRTVVGLNTPFFLPNCLNSSEGFIECFTQIASNDG